MLFKRLKEEMIGLKDEGRVLVRFNELRDALRLRLTGGNSPFNEELKTVVGLLVRGGFQDADGQTTGREGDAAVGGLWRAGGVFRSGHSR